MNPYDILCLAVIGLCIGLALFYIIKKKVSGNGGCIGCPDAPSCSGCNKCKGCTSCPASSKSDKEENN